MFGDLLGRQPFRVQGHVRRVNFTGLGATFVSEVDGGAMRPPVRHQVNLCDHVDETLAREGERDASQGSVWCYRVLTGES